MCDQREPTPAETCVEGPKAKGRRPHGAPAAARAERKRLCPSLERQAEERRLSKEQARDLADARAGVEDPGQARIVDSKWLPGRRLRLVYECGQVKTIGPL